MPGSGITRRSFVLRDFGCLIMSFVSGDIRTDFFKTIRRGSSSPTPPLPLWSPGRVPTPAPSSSINSVSGGDGGGSGNTRTLD